MSGRPLAVVTTRCLPDLGGIETHVAEVTRRVVALGRHDVEVLTTDRTGRLPRVEQVDGYTVRRFRAYPSERDWYASPGLAWWLLRHPRRYAAIHVQGVHTLVPPLAMLLGWLTRTPYLITFHTGGSSIGLRNRARGLQFGLLAPLLRRARLRIGVSAFEQQRFAEITGAPVRLIRNGGSLPDPGAVEADADLVLSVGRLERYKGHHRAIEALPALRERRPDARLRILGSGPAEAELRELARARGVADTVEITSVDPADRGGMARQLAGAGAVVLLSEYEAHPVAVMEALAVGRPVVVARTSGLTELEAMGWARATELHDPPAVVAATIARQLEDPLPAPREALPTWDTCAAELAAAYDEVVTSR